MFLHGSQVITVAGRSLAGTVAKLRATLSLNLSFRCGAQVLLQRLGQGASGTVYKALDILEMRIVALKVMAMMLLMLMLMMTMIMVMVMMTVMMTLLVVIIIITTTIVVMSPFRTQAVAESVWPTAFAGDPGARPAQAQAAGAGALPHVRAGETFTRSTAVGHGGTGEEGWWWWWW
jgi:hypothetical protein